MVLETIVSLYTVLQTHTHPPTPGPRKYQCSWRTQTPNKHFGSLSEIQNKLYTNLSNAHHLQMNLACEISWGFHVRYHNHTMTPKIISGVTKSSNHQQARSLGLLRRKQKQMANTWNDICNHKHLLTTTCRQSGVLSIAQHNLNPLWIYSLKCY